MNNEFLNIFIKKDYKINCSCDKCQTQAKIAFYNENDYEDDLRLLCDNCFLQYIKNKINF